MAHRDIGKDVVHPVGGPLGHPPAAATRTEGAALTGKGDQPIQPAVTAAEPREPAGEPATPKNAAKLGLDEPRQPVPVPEARGLCAERLEVVAHDLVQQTVRRRPRRVLWGGQGHAPRGGGHRAGDDATECACLQAPA